MALTDKEIRALLKSGELAFEPFEDSQIRASSVDLRLDSFARVVTKGAALDIRMPPEQLAEHFETIKLGDEGYTLQPKALLIGQTMEHIKVPVTTQGSILQRSGLVRLGLQVTSSILNPGYKGNLPILVFNLTDSAIKVEAGIRICQLSLSALSERPELPYSEEPGAKYLGERQFELSRISEDVELAKYRKDLDQIAASAVETAKKKGLL